MDVNRLARSIRALRRRRGWRQEDLASAAGMSRSAIARLEQGRGDRLTVKTLEGIAAALDARFVWRIDWRGEALDRLVDEGHAALVEHVVARLTSWGWLCAVEVSFSVYGERGSIDILAFHPEARVLLVVEVKTAIGDNQATLMALDRKHRLATRLASERGWKSQSVGRLLVLPDQSTARRQVDRLAATYAAALPARSHDVVRWLRRPGLPLLDGIWFPSLDPQKVAGRCAGGARPSPTQRTRVTRPRPVQAVPEGGSRDRVESD